MIHTTAILVCGTLLSVCDGSSLANLPVPDKARSDPVDAEGEPLPAGALARLGSIRWRHGAEVIGSALSRDGKLLATASSGSVLVWELATGKVLFRFPKSNQDAWCSGADILAFSPDGKKLGCSFSRDFRGVWDLEKGGKFQKLGNFEGALDAGGFCQFTTDGSQLILCEQQYRVSFWDVATGKVRKAIPTRDTPGRAYLDAGMYDHFEVTEDNQDCVFVLRDLRTNALIKKFDLSPRDGWFVLAPDCRKLGLVNWKTRKIQVRDWPGDRLIRTFAMPESAVAAMEKDGFHFCVRFTSDSKVLMLASGDGVIHRWDVTSARKLQPIGRGLLAPVGLHDLPDRKSLVAVGSDGLIRRFDTAANREISGLGNYQGCTQAAVSADGRLAAVADSRGRVDLWDLQALKPLRTFRTEGPELRALAFTPDGKTLAVGLATEKVHFHDVASGREVKAISFEKKKSDALCWPLSTMLLSPDGRLLCVNTGEDQLLMWDLANNEVRWRIEGKAWPSAAFTPDGKTLAFATCGNKVALLDARTGKLQRSITVELPGKMADDIGVHALAFSPDGLRLSAVLANGTVVLLDTDSGRVLRSLAANGTWSFVTPSFSPDGRRVAASNGRSVRVWDTLSGKLMNELDGHTCWVSTLAFGPDGRTLLTCGQDSQVYLWAVSNTSVEQ